MPTLIYTPAVQVVIESTKAYDPVTGKQATEEQPVLIDVSDDLVDGTMTRRSDGPSTFNFSMQNLRRKYDYIFSPNDRVLVKMKRLTWLHVYTGYLNAVPLFSVWPRVVQVESTCSLKRLQYFFWDATLPASENLIRSHLLGGTANQEDGGARNVMKALLTDVVAWPEQNIHIGQIPANWFDFAAQIAADVAQDAAAADNAMISLMNAVGIHADVGGSASTTTGTSHGITANQNIGNNIDPDTNNPIPGTGTMPYSHGTVTWFTGDLDGKIDTATAGTTLSPWNIDADSLYHSAAPYYCAIWMPFLAGPGKGIPYPGMSSHDMKAAQAWWKGKLVVIKNPSNGKQVICQIAAWTSRNGSHSTTPILVSPQALKALRGGSKEETIPNCTIGFVDNADQATASLGPYLGTNPAGTKPGQGTTTAQGLLSWALQVDKGLKIPYSEGGAGEIQYNRLDNIKSNTPSALDCSAFICWAFFHTTGHLIANSNVAGIIAYCQSNTDKGAKKISVAEGMATQGAIMTLGADTHTEMSVGNGAETVGEHHDGTFASRVTNNDWDAAWLLPYVDYSQAKNGQPPVGVTPGDASGQASSTTNNPFAALGGGNPQTDLSDGPFDTLFKNTTWVPVDDVQAELRSAALTGVRALLNDEPILPYIKNLVNMSMRSFCSAPNGDFIAWFPDYYGLWGTAAKMVIEPIEIVDFTVDWSDDAMVTHQFVSSAWSSQFNTADGTLQTLMSDPEVTTVGIATIDIPSIMQALFGKALTAKDFKKFRETIYKRFGPRPDYQQAQGIYGPKGEFFYALFLFMRQWAYQYNANVQLTFMPEIFPGMLLQIPDPRFNFQAYVTTVTHSFRFGQNGSFTTTVNIASPARLNDSMGLLGFPSITPTSGLFDRGALVEANDRSAAKVQRAANGVAQSIGPNLPTGKDLAF